MTKEQLDIVLKWKKIFHIRRLPKIIFKKDLRYKGEKLDGLKTGSSKSIQIDEIFKNDLTGFDKIIGHEFWHFKNDKWEDEITDILGKTNLDQIYWRYYEEFINKLIEQIIKYKRGNNVQTCE